MCQKSKNIVETNQLLSTFKRSFDNLLRGSSSASLRHHFKDALSVATSLIVPPHSVRQLLSTFVIQNMVDSLHLPPFNLEHIFAFLQ